MSTYHVLGITHKGELDELTCGDVKADVLNEALEFASSYRQLFLVSENSNVQELIFTLTVKGTIQAGSFMPTVHDLDLDSPL